MVLKKYCLFVLILAALLLFVGCNNVQNKIQAEKSEEIKEEFINDEIRNMTIVPKIGQLFMVEYRTDSDGNNIIEINEHIKDSIFKYHLGGIILFAENMEYKTKKV